MTLLESFLADLSGVRQTADGHEAFCPNHESAGEAGGHRQSLAISLGVDGRILLTCRAGCKAPQIVYAVGWTMSELFPEQRARWEVAATYDYHDESGTLLFQVVRKEKSGEEKRITQRRPDGKGGWIDNTKGVRRIPYRLCELLASPPAEPVLIAEGEKCVNKLRDMGFVATCNPGGAGKWRKEFSNYFRESQPVILFEDNDQPGRAHVDDVATKLRSRVSTIRIVRFPELSEKSDVADWIAAGGTKEQLLERIAAADDWSPSPVAAEAPEGQTPVAAADLLDFDKDTIRNAKITKTDEGTFIDPICMEMITLKIRERSNNWPRRVGQSLFVHSPGRRPEWISSTAALFGWLGTVCPPPAKFATKIGCHSREEVFHELQRTSLEYESIELLPHEPLLSGAYYCDPAPASGDGAALDGLVTRFKGATEFDKSLIKAAFVTPGWGGKSGARPAFTITSDDGRGVGKTTLSAMIAYLYGGAIEVSAQESAEIIKQRLLSAEGLSRRVVLLDNVKSLRFSWSELESLITAPFISGKKLYVGEAQRRNNLQWMITLNGASFSTDMAQRSVFVKLLRPDHEAGWMDATRDYIDANRAAIIADVLGFLRSDSAPLKRFSRWAAWEQAVLSRLPNPAEIQKLIAERQNVADVEAEETDIIEDFFFQKLRELEYEPLEEKIFIPSLIACQWFNAATNERHSATATSRIIKQKIGERSLSRLMENRCGTYGRGFVWTPDDWNGVSDIRIDIEEKLKLLAESQLKRRTEIQMGCRDRTLGVRTA